MKRALSFLLSFAMMFSAFAPAVSAMEDIPSVASNEYGTVVYYAVNGDEQSGQVNGNTVYVNEMGMITFTANDENGEQLDIVGITVDPAAYRETNILDNGIAVVGVSEGASAEELYTVKVEVSDGTEATMYYVAKPNTPAVEPEQPTDDGVFDLESATVWIDYLGGSMTAAETLKGGIVPVRKGQSFAVYAVDADGTYTTKGNQFLGIVSDNGFEIMVEDYTEIDGCLGQLVTIPDDPSIGINAQGFSVGFISGAVQKWFNFNIEVGAAVNSYVLTGLDNALDATKLTGSHGMTQGSYCGIAFTVDDEYRDAANVDFYLSETMAAAGFSAERASGTLKDGTAVSFWNLYSDKTTPTGEYTATFEIWGEEFPVTINITKGNDGEIVEPEPGFSYTGQYTGSVYWRYAGESGWRELSTGKSYCAADTIKADVFQEIELQFIDDSEFVTDSIWFPNGDPEYMFEEFDYDNHILSLRTDSTAVLRNLKEGFAYQTDFAVNDGQRYIFQFTVQEEEVTLPATVFSGTAKIIVGSHDAPEYLDFNNFGAGASENNCLGVKFFDTNGAPVDANRVKPVISSLPAGIDIHWGYDNWTAENGSTGVYNEWEFWFNENIQPGSYDMQFVIDDSYTATVTLNVIEDSGEGPGAGGEEIEYFGDPHVYWWRGANMSEKDAVEYGWTSSDLEVIEISTDNTLFIRTKDSNGTIVPVNGWSFIDATDSDLAGLDWGENDFGDFVVIIGENAAPGQRNVKISNAMGEFVFCFEIVADEGGEGGDGDEGEENGYFDWAYGTSQMLPSSGKVTLEIVEFGPGNATGDVFVAKHIEDGDRFEILGDVYQSIISVDKNGNGGPLSCTVNIDLAREIYGESGDFWINLSLVTDNGPTQTWGFKIGGEDDDTPEEEPDNTDAPYAKWANGLESSDDFVVPQDSTFTAPIETGNITDQTVAVLLGYVDEETEGNPFVPFETQKGLSFTYDENGLPTSCTFDGEVIAQAYPELAQQGWFHVAIVITYKDGSKLTGGRDVEFPGENTGEGGLHLEWDLSDTDGEMTVQLINDYTAYNIIQTGSADTLGDGYVRVLLGYVDEDTMEFVPFNYSAGLYAYYDENNIPYKCEFNGAEIMEAFGAVYEGDYFHVAFVYFNGDHEIIATHGRDVPLVREGGEGGDSGNTPPVVHTLFSVTDKTYDELFMGDDIITYLGESVHVKVYNVTDDEVFEITEVTPDSATTSTEGIVWTINDDGTVKFRVGTAAEEGSYGFNLAAGGTTWDFALEVYAPYEDFEREDAINTLYYLNGEYGGYYHEEEGGVSATHGDTVSFKTINYATDGGIPVEEINFTETEGYTVYCRNNEVIVEIGSDAAEDLTVSAVVGGKTYNFKIELTVLEWWVNGDILFITGSGEMPDYDNERDHPWYDYRNSIRVIEFISGLTTINDSAFYGFSNLEEVTFSAPEGQEPSIRVIENNAFGNCENLSEIILPDSLEELWGGAFSGSAITNINIPKNLTDIDVQAFSGMDALTNVSYDSANPVYKVHYGCIIENDTNIAMVLPYTTELYVPSYVTSIDGHAKVFAEQVTKISVLSDNTKYYAEDGVLFSTNYYGDKVIEWYPEGRSGTEYIIPRGTKYIEQFAFQRCNLEKLYVYAGIEEVDMSWAFSSAENLETIYFYGTEAQFNNTAFNVYEGVEVIRLDDPDAPLVDDGVFDATDATVYIEKPGAAFEGVVFPGEELLIMFRDKDGTMLKYEDRSLITAVGSDMPDYDIKWHTTGINDDILCVVLPIGEVESGEYMIDFTFNNRDDCTYGFDFQVKDLEIISSGKQGKLNWTIYIDGGLEITGSGAIPNLEPALDENEYFVNPHPWGAYADDVTSITVADTITSIGDCAFMNMWCAEEVTLGNKVNYIGDMAFANCKELTEITLPANLEMIKDYVFEDTSISELVIPAKVKSVAPYSFANMSNLDSFSIDEANTNLVFEDGIIWRISRGNKTAVVRAMERFVDSNLELVIPETVTAIENHAFAGCDISSVTLGSKVATIGVSAFEYGWFDKVELGSGVKTIETGAFTGANIDEFVMGPNVTTIKAAAFGEAQFKELVMGNKVSKLEPYVFVDSELEKVVLSTALKAIPEGTFAGADNLKEVFIPKTVTTIDTEAFDGCNNLEYIYFGGTEVQWNNIKVAAGNEALENAKVLFEIAPGVCSIKVMDSNSGEDTAIAPLQNIKRYNDDINLMYAFEISKYKAGEIEWTVTSSNENVVQVVFVSDPWSYTEGEVEFETKDVELNVVGKGKAVVTFTAKDTLTNTTKTYKVTYNVTQMATSVELTVTGTKNRADEYALIAGKTLAPKIKWIGGNPWSADEYSFNIETEESIEDGIPVVDPVKGTVTTYADTKYDKVGNITAYATEPGSYVLTFVAAAEDANGNVVCDIVENLPIHVYTEMASAVNVDRTKVILDPMAHETETIISAWVENEGQACGDVAFTWTANDNFLVVDNGDNNVYVKLLNNNKGSITITATAMDGSKKSAKITVSSGVLVEYLEVTSTLPTVEIPTEFVNEEEGTSEWINVPHHVLAKGKTNKLTTTIAPSNATNKTVLWSSSDESVVTVDKNGTIKGIAAGTAYIDAFAESGYCGTRFYVVVTEPVTNVAIDWNNDLNAGVEIVESKGAITVPLGDVYADDATYIFLDSIISNANGIDADYPAEAIEWTVAGGNGIDSGWYEEHDDDGNLTLKKYVVAIFEAGKYTVTAKALDGTNKSAKLTINAEQTVFDMRVEAPAGIGVNDYSEKFADVGTVWVTTAGTKFAPAVVFNYGDKDRQPSKAQQAYEIILEGDAADYLTVAGKNVTAKAVPENDRCLTSFTVKAGDFEETINVVILPKGEQPIVNREMVFNEADQRIVAAGSTVPVTTYINGKKGLPSGYKFVRWELKKFGEIEHDGEGGRVELIPVDSSLFSGKATSITFSENLEPMVPYTLIMVIADKNGMLDYIEKDIVITAKPKASDIKLREVEYEIVDDEYLLIKNVTDTYLTDYTKANPLTPADGIKVFAVETTENAIGYYEGVPYTFKLSNAKAAELFTELPGIYEATGDEAYFVAIDPNAAGSIKLTVTAGDFSKVSATLPFEIAKVDNPVKQIVTKATTYNVDIHDVIEIDFSLIGEKAGMDIAHTEVEWTVSAPDILSICDGSQYDPEGENYFAGYITTTGESGSLVLDGFSDKTGKVVITGTAMDGSNKSVKINVTVEKEKASGEDRLMLDVPANTPNGGENGVAILTWGKTMKLNPTILATNPKGKAVSYEVFKVTEPYGDVVEGVPSEVTVDKNGTVKVGKYAINKKTGEEVIPYTGWIKVVGKLDYKQRSWNPETDMPGMMEIFDEVYIYVQQPATGLSVSYTENGESKTTTKAVNVTVPAGESITFTAEQLYGYAGGPDLEIGTPAWTMAANDFADAYHPYDVDGEEYIEFKDMYTVDVREDAPVNKTFKIKAFTQDGSNKNIQITIKVGEPL